MSGGVDSSVAALLLKQQGYDVVGCSMHLYSCNRPASKSCCSAEDRLDARNVCEKIGIQFISLDYRSLFREKVIAPFIDEYQNGRTPSPCVLCNQHMKFRALLEEAEKHGAVAVATGHYARVEMRDGAYRLLRGADPKKDQSYFLFTLTQENLKKIYFPIGGLTKDEVRKIARDHGLPTSEKKESQEICFVPDNDYASFIESIRPSGIAGPGNFVGTDGKILGRHKGIHGYTVGQRRGLGFGVGARQYVVRIDPRTNEVVLGSGGDLLKREMTVGGVSWVDSKRIAQRAIEVQIRSTHAAAVATADPIGACQVKIRFEKPQRAVAPGQAAVFYSGDEVLGGGFID